jgi:hypothetical protein
LLDGLDLRLVVVNEGLVLFFHKRVMVLFGLASDHHLCLDQLLEPLRQCHQLLLDPGRLRGRFRLVALAIVGEHGRIDTVGFGAQAAGPRSGPHLCRVNDGDPDFGLVQRSDQGLFVAARPPLEVGMQTGDPPWAAASQTNNGHTPDPQSLLVPLLSDIRQVFARSQADRLSLTHLVESLCAMPDRPWRKANRSGRPVNEIWLGRKLRLIGVAARTIRIGNATARGYNLTDFSEVFSRFLIKPGAGGT